MKHYLFCTAYYGIYIQEQDGHYWIVTDCGCDDYYGTTMPSKLQVTEYRNRMLKG